MSKINLSITFLAILLIYFSLSIPYFSGDVRNHIVWAESILKIGPLGLYNRTFHDFAYPNYPPLTMWFFVISTIIFEIVRAFIWFLNNSIALFPSDLMLFIESLNFKIAFFKLPALASTLGIAWLAHHIISKFHKVRKRILLSLFFLLNPAIFFLAVVWGQVDQLPIFFLLLSTLFLFKDKPFLTGLFSAFALLSKQTVIIFWLVLLILAFKKFNLKDFLKMFFTTIVVVYFFYIPFVGLNPFDIMSLYISNFEYVAKATQVNAINLWGLLYDFQIVEDSRIFFGLSFQYWGYLLFAIFALPVLFIIGKINLSKFKDSKNLWHLVLFSFFLLSTSYFLTLTRMHERYLIPAVIFAYLMFLFEKAHLVNLIFFSALTFLNLYRGLEMPDFGFLRTLVFSTPFLDMLVVSYGLLNIYNLILFMRFAKKDGS